MPVDSLTPGEPPTPQPVPPQTTHPIPPPPMVTGAWIPLSQLQPKFFDRPPNSLRFSDGTQATLGSWWKLPVELVGWLATNGILTAAGCPIQHAKRYLVNVSPVHPSGKPFLQDKAVGSFHVETKYSGPDHARNARLILKHLGQDLTKFSVQS